MQQLLIAPPAKPCLRFLDCLGEEGPSPYPTDRWLAAAQMQLHCQQAEAVLEILSQSLGSLRPGQPGRLNAACLQRLWDHFRDQPAPVYASRALEKFSLTLEPAECLLLSSLLPELRALELRHQAYTRLSGKVSAVVRDTLEVLRLFLGAEGQLPDGFEEALLEVVQGWCNRLWMSEEEGRHALCVLWATHMAGRFQAPQQEWRYCLACLEQTLYRHVGPGSGRLLQSYWNGLAAATGIFELCALVCKQLPALLPRLKCGFFDAQELIGSLLGELLLDFDPLQEGWPTMAALSAAAAPVGGASLEEFSAFRRALLAGLRPHMERNWLDLLAGPLDRVQAHLQLRAWKVEQRAALQQATTRACNSLREVLQAFNANPKAEQDLRALLEAAWECVGCGRTALDAQHLFRRWLGAVYVPFVAPKWQQPKAVVAALKTALQGLPEGGSIKGLLPLLELLPATCTEVCDGLRAGHSWLTECGLERRAWQLWLGEGSQAPQSLSRLCLREWSFEQESAARPSLQQLRQRCPEQSTPVPFETMEKKLERSWLSHQVWSQAEAIARQASAWTFRKLSDYARQVGTARGLEKCARDNSFTLRRVALAWELEVEDPVSFLSDWWNGMVNAYLTGRPSQLFLTNLQGLLQSSRDYLEPHEVSHLEAVLRPVYEEAAGQEESPAVDEFQAVAWQFPLQQKLECPAPLNLSEELVQAALRLNGPLSKPVGPWRNLLQEGWRRYLWQGCLDTLTTQRWLDYLEENRAQPQEMQRFLQGLVWAQDQHSLVQALPALDYLQALLDFTGQWQAAPPFASLPAPLSQWEADRLALEQASRDGASPSALHRLAAVYTLSPEALFSPNPEEEVQWRQVLGSLLVAALREQPQEEAIVFWALCGSVKIVRNRDFEQRLSKVEQMLAAGCPDVPGEVYGPAFDHLRRLAPLVRQLEVDARSQSDLLLLASPLPLAWSSSAWATPRTLRLSWACQPEKPGGALAAAWTRDFDLAGESQSRVRELRWASRQLAWQAWLEEEGQAPPGWAAPDLDLPGLFQVAQQFAQHDWPAGVSVCIRALQDKGDFLKLGVAAARPRLQPWLAGPSLHKAGSESALTPAEQSDLEGFGQLLAEHTLEVVALEQLSASFQLRLQQLNHGGYDRVCESLLAALPGSGLDPLEQLSLTIGLQAVQNSLRHMRLGLKLTQLLQEPSWTHGCRPLLEFQAQLWQWSTPELSWFNLLARLQQKPEWLPAEEPWQLLVAEVSARLDESERRMWLPWCRHMGRLSAEVERSLPLVQGPLCSARRAEPQVPRLVLSLLALDVAREAQLPGGNAQTRAVLADLTNPAVAGVRQSLEAAKSQRIDLDFAPLERQLSHLGRWLQRPLSLQEQIQEQFPGLLGDNPEQVAELLETLSDPLAQTQGTWWAPRALLLTPRPLLQRLAALPEMQWERLQTALSNALGENGRWLDACRRLPALEEVWQRSEQLVLGGQTAHPFWRSLLRRVALEGWMEGRPYHSQGVLTWIRFNLSPAEGQDSSRKPFLKAARDVLQWGRDKGSFSEGMARLGEETLRSLERRLGAPGLTLWESLDHPTLDASTAQKPFKRSLWGRISSSLEGLVRGR